MLKSKECERNKEGVLYWLCPRICMRMEFHDVDITDYRCNSYCPLSKLHVTNIANYSTLLFTFRYNGSRNYHNSPGW